MQYTNVFRYSSGYDWTYLIIIIILLILSFVVQGVVKSKYNKYTKVVPMSGLTGAEAARKFLDANGVISTKIVNAQSKDLADYYDPKTDTICLSDSCYNKKSIAAIGVACHEAGHAVQAAEGYGPYRLRAKCIPFANISSKIAVPLILAGLILSAFASQLKFLALVGIILYAVAVFAQLVTLPVEFDASNRALSGMMSTGILSESETKGARSVLTAAALTYVVTTLVALVNLLRFISVLNRR